ncbi:4-dimethylallyltryptophan N-methyltransferase [Fusarium acutatum]|uniref:4-dimethylallyltryptophan N-methyltransferase n=1 Tax=Fusarium acutatum TaxID=78861 RepID=A0A8H4JCZ3_9HYPO|nr:4-dimethylallyltryptophan N-methyltransferase [Fusarium acutatum]
MSPLYTKSWAPAHKEIIDVGGSTLDTTFDSQLPSAFKGEGHFPKEVAYTTGMHHWCEIADGSYQTTDELEIIKATASDVVKDMPATGAVIIDLGAANSRNVVSYVQAFIEQGQPCIYIALDLCKESLTKHVSNPAADFPQITCIGLWGNFIQGDKYFPALPNPRISLSIGSISFNAPDQMCADRCMEFSKHLSGSPYSKLIVGQDGPSSTDASSTHAAYQTKAYDAFFISYLQGIQTHANIDANPRVAWTYESKLYNSMHYFKVVAQHDMVCHRYNDFFIQNGTIYTMFPFWKRGETEIHGIAKTQGLDIKTLGKAPNSGIRQCLIQPRI